MATRLYIANNTAPYDPSATQGAWELTTGYIIKELATAATGVAANKQTSETSSNSIYDVLLGQWVSDTLLSAVNFTTSHTIAFSIGILEASSAADFISHLHVYVTQGNSSSVRGTLLTDSIADTTEWPTTAASRYHSQNLSNNVSAQAGDRIVVEFGYRATNSVSTSYYGRVHYGCTSGDLNAADGDTDVTTKSGWVQFSNDFSFGAAASRRIMLISKLIPLTFMTALLNHNPSSSRREFFGKVWQVIASRWIK